MYLHNSYRHLHLLRRLLRRLGNTLHCLHWFHGPHRKHFLEGLWQRKRLVLKQQRNIQCQDSILKSRTRNRYRTVDTRSDCIMSPNFELDICARNQLRSFVNAARTAYDLHWPHQAQRIRNRNTIKLSGHNCKRCSLGSTAAATRRPPQQSCAPCLICVLAI